ncbi:MAG TPA: SMC family ATPase, partial [Phototrophicaceae bacterium]|nr:SMC family ATPase [Phototrophicaceae bacterium]
GVEMRERLKTLQSTDAATCPVCGQPLDAEHRQQLIAQIGDEIEAHRAAWAERNTHIKDMEKQRKEANLQVKTVEASLKQLPTLLENAGKLQAQIDAAAQAAIRLEEDVTRQEAVIAQLQAEDFALDIRDALAELDSEQDALGYDKSTHDATRRSLDEYRRYEQLQTRLAIALESLPAIEEALSGARIRQERLDETLEQIDEQLNALEIEIAGLLVQVEEYNQREQEVRAQHTRRNSAYERLVNIQQALSSLEAQAARKVELEQRRERYRHEEGVYKELKTAFGRNGIPAMIIETAIPELEVTANELLMRMTDGRMNLRLTTQKEKITGGVQETLDIEIADELGTRSYEMYSGGEAFRINFAIRVALSQMLARRAGAHLRTLFIDEGFGTQDDEGRSRLVEAITAIQDDFDLILVITHIDELRDSFPVHVVVEKTSSGSMVSVR